MAIAPVLKTGTLHGVRGFESHLLRQSPRRSTDRTGTCGVSNVSSILAEGTPL